MLLEYDIAELKLNSAFLDSGLHNNKSVRLPGKQVLAETADKQKTVPEEADRLPLGDCFCCFIVISELKYVVKCEKIVVLRGFRGYFDANSCSPVANK